MYACDVLSRPGSDAVVAVLFEINGHKTVRVLLRDGARPPIYLRRNRTFVHPDPRVYLSLKELVAGMVEPIDGAGDEGLVRRAAAEADEEVDLRVPPESFRVIGGETFASPGTSDEKLYFCAAPVELAAAGPGRARSSGVTLRWRGLYRLALSWKKWPAILFSRKVQSGPRRGTYFSVHPTPIGFTAGLQTAR